jgi:hypothetical protein
MRFVCDYLTNKIKFLKSPQYSYQLPDRIIFFESGQDRYRELATAVWPDSISKTTCRFATQLWAVTLAMVLSACARGAPGMEWFFQNVSLLGAGLACLTPSGNPEGGMRKVQ